MSDRIGRVVTFEGDVQGVGFRATCVAAASNLVVFGTVANRGDGSVRLDVEGPPIDVDRLLSRISRQMRHHIREQHIEKRQPAIQSADGSSPPSPGIRIIG